MAVGLLNNYQALKNVSFSSGVIKDEQPFITPEMITVFQREFDLEDPNNKRLLFIAEKTLEGLPEQDIANQVAEKFLAKRDYHGQSPQDYALNTINLNRRLFTIKLSNLSN
jgi:hypothetical protein